LLDVKLWIIQKKLDIIVGIGSVPERTRLPLVFYKLVQTKTTPYSEPVVFDTFIFQKPSFVMTTRIFKTSSNHFDTLVSVVDQVRVPFQPKHLPKKRLADEIEVRAELVTDRMKLS
jgi:hypothetical protein